MNTDGSCQLKTGGVQTTITYNGANQPLVITDVLGHTTTHTYDGGGYLTSVTNALNQTTSYTYTTVSLAAGGTTTLVETVTDPLGRVTTYAYNDLGQVATITNALSQVTSYEYDSGGRLITITSPGPVAECREYDNANQLIATVRNCVPGQPAEVDQNVRTEYGYDGSGRRIWVKGPTGEVTRTLYDGRGLVERTIAGCYTGGDYSTTTCDPFSPADPHLNRVTAQGYDDRGRRVTMTDPRPVTVTHAYDLADRLVGTSAPGLTTIAQAYDVAGRRTSLVDETGTTTYAYDGLDRLLAATHSVTGTVGHSWDLAGRRTGLGASGGLGGTMPALGYAYDDAGRLTTVTKGGVDYVTATYDPPGRLWTMTRYNGGVAGATTQYDYDGWDRLTLLETTQGGTTLATLGYASDRAARLIFAYEAIGGTSRTVDYGYDGLGRLVHTSASVGNNYDYAYDPAGNRTSVTVNGGTPTTTAYDAADQVVGWDYDDAGNLLDDGTQTYTWDPLGRLASTITGGTTTTYGYDGDHTLALQADGTSTTRYTIDTQGGLAERLGAATTTGGGPADIAWYLRGWGTELGREDTGGTPWYLADRLGSTRAEYDALGNLTTRVDYDPFGQPEAGTGLGDPTDHGFTGEPQDGTTGLVQLRARWYQPITGQFLSRDPFGGNQDSPLSFNPYSYGHADPVNNTDPTGMFVGEGSGSGGGAVQPGDVGSTATQVLATIRGLAGGGVCAPGNGMILLAAPPEQVQQVAWMIAAAVGAAAVGATMTVGGMAVAGGAAALTAGAAVTCAAICPVLITIALVTVLVLVVAVAVAEPVTDTTADTYDEPHPSKSPAPSPPPPGVDIIPQTKVCNPSACEYWKNNILITRQASTLVAGWAAYQRQHAGLNEYLIGAYPFAYFADGIDCAKCEIVETKYAEPWGDYEKGPPSAAYNDYIFELRVAKSVILDPTKPVVSMRVVTNSDLAYLYLQNLIDIVGTPGRCMVWQ